MALDRFGRSINYLRISLTDKCNLRCVYCMPENMVFRPKETLLQDDELLRLVRVFTELGFNKFRLTGGEPTIRQNVVEIVRGIASTPGVNGLSMTTNGILLGKLAQPLADAGLQRVNISIDTLDPDKFHKITRWGHLDEVWAGIEASERAGLTPIKLNAVVVRGFNEGDVTELAKLTVDRDWQFRFIEMMPFGDVAT
ncbi:MAG: radical SAM protein, partial [Burkholderiales bacterium]|nr:radical SAM protein [Anaerolineae bacterium]